MTILIETIASAVGSDLSFVDLPTPGAVVGPCLTAAGWFVLPKAARDVRVLISLRNLGDKLLVSAVVGSRPDVHAEVQLPEDVVACGYEAQIHGYDLPPEFELEVRAYFEDVETTETLLASIIGTKSPEARVQKSAFDPIYVVGLARSGTTVLTRMIGAHPAIACGDKYPLELCASAFYAKMARLAASTADLSGYSKSNLFAENDTLGPNPFASLNHLDRDTLLRVVRASSDVYVQAAADATDAWYAAIAGSDRERTPYFVEKSQPGRVLVSSLNVFPRARCVLLVRDPRDSFLSKIRFNRKRGTKDFGELVARDFTHWAELHVQDHCALLDHHVAFQRRFADVVRYEDLMTDPREVLTRLCHLLGIDASPDVVSRMIAVGQDASGHFAAHRTGDGEDGTSLGGELPLLGAAIATDLSHFLDRYGYTR